MMEEAEEEVKGLQDTTGGINGGVVSVGEGVSFIGRRARAAPPRQLRILTRSVSMDTSIIPKNRHCAKIRDHIRVPLGEPLTPQSQPLHTPFVQPRLMTPDPSASRRSIMRTVQRSISTDSGLSLDSGLPLHCISALIQFKVSALYSMLCHILFMYLF